MTSSGCEKSRLLQPMQNGNDVFVSDTGSGDIRTDLAHVDAPFTQPPDFDVRDIFVDDEHAA